MIFDAFCGIAERNWPEVVPLLKRAHIFEFPGDPLAVLPKQYDDAEVALMSETFFLPFPVVAVEDTVSCVILFDAKPDQSGINTVRFFADCLPIDARTEVNDGGGVLSEEERIKLISIVGPNAYQITFGRILEFTIDNAREKPILVSGRADRSVLANKHKVFADDRSMHSSAEATALSAAALRNAKTAIEELVYFNTPNRFVVEKTAVRKQRPNPNVEIKRSDERPHYILLTPAEIRAKVESLSGPAASEAQRKHPQAHHRRRHYRKFSDERYSEATRGKVITIPATWVGPDEGSDGHNHYKVRLDL